MRLIYAIQAQINAEVQIDEAAQNRRGKERKLMEWCQLGALFEKASLKPIIPLTPTTAKTALIIIRAK
jgi:hypothetical protein